MSKTEYLIDGGEELVEEAVGNLGEVVNVASIEVATVNDVNFGDVDLTSLGVEAGRIASGLVAASSSNAKIVTNS